MNRNRLSKQGKTDMGMGSRVNHLEQTHIPQQKLITGSLANRTPVMLSDGRTTIYVKPDANISERKSFWEERLGKVC